MTDASNTASRLSLLRILPLTLTGFLAVMTETMPVGMLGQLASGLRVDEAVAGQLVAVYAAGSFLAIIPIVSLTRGFNRKVVLLSALAGFLLTNLAVAVSDVFWLVAIERFLSGVSAGVAWGLIAGYTVRVSPPARAGRALAIMGAGQPVALAIGVPLVATAVQWMAWYWVFTLGGLLAALVWLWCLLVLPGVPGERPAEREPLIKVVASGNILAILATLMCWIAGHNALYTYVSPYLHAQGHWSLLGLVLLLFGASSFIGILLTSIFVDRAHDRITGLSLLAFLVAALLFWWWGSNTSVLVLAVVLWGFSFGGAPTLLIKYLADSAGEQIDLAQAAFATVFNASVFMGSLLGGMLLHQVSALAQPMLMLGLAMLAMLAWWLGVRKNSALVAG